MLNCALENNPFIISALIQSVKQGIFFIKYKI